MSLIQIDACDYEINVRFTVDNIHEFLDVPPGAIGPKRRSTDVFAHGWSFDISWTRNAAGDDCLGVWLRPPAEGCPRPVFYAVRGESLGGKHYFEGSSTYLFPPRYTGRGWKHLLSRTRNWEADDSELRAEDTLVVFATIQTPPGPRASAPSTLDAIYRVVVRERVKEANFIVFAHRSSSGWLSGARTLTVNCDLLATHSTHFNECLEGLSPLMHPCEDDHSADGLARAGTDYKDADSDFEDDGEDERMPAGGFRYNDGVTTEAGEGEGAISRASRRESDTEMLNIKPPSPLQSMKLNLDGFDMRPPPSEAAQTMEGDLGDLAEHSLNESISSGRARAAHGGITFGTYVVTGASAVSWEALIFYLYTGMMIFAPLKSEGAEAREFFVKQHREKYPNRPVPCSSKSIYRLASELGLRDLKGQALDFLRGRLSAETILDEIFSSFTSRHDEIKALEIAVLTEHWDVLNGSAELKRKLAESTSGHYPHASWIIAECFEKLAEPKR